MRVYRVEWQGQQSYARGVSTGSGAGTEELELLSGAPWAGGSPTGRRAALAEVRLLAPVTPSKIVCIGRNYAGHAKELGNQVPDEPLLFLKPSSSLIGPGDPIVLPAQSQRVEHESEIGVVIGKRLQRADAAAAAGAIFGLTCVNDVTARDLQRKDVQFTRAKGFDTFCPVGPWIETELALDALTVSARVSGQQRQHGHVSQMIFGIAALTAFISNVMTLEPGDLISTGTPEGVGPLVDGDTVEVEVSGIGVLRNPVQSRS